MDNEDELLEAVLLKSFFRLGLVLFLVGCGIDERPNTIPTLPPPLEKTTWLEIEPLVVSECARCHNGVRHPLNLNTEDKYNQPKVKARIESGSMPPDRKLPLADKQRLLGYF